MAEAERPAGADAMRDLVERSYAELRSAFERIPLERWDEPLLPGGWSAKEDLAHVTFWENALVAYVDGSAELEGPPDPPFGDTAVVNGAVRAWAAAQPPDAVRDRADRVHARLREFIAPLTDAQLDEIVPKGREPWWRAVAAETWDHYPEHLQMLRAAFPD